MDSLVPSSKKLKRRKSLNDGTQSTEFYLSSKPILPLKKKRKKSSTPVSDVDSSIRQNHSKNPLHLKPEFQDSNSTQPPMLRVSDVSEARTIFIRNLSFDANEEQLLRFFSNFGTLEFIKIVKDKLTQHSRGTAFAKFSSKDDASRILSESSQLENSHRFVFAGRKLILSLAVTKDEVQKLQKARSGGNDLSSSDNANQGRNLHLARFGLIRSGTVAAANLTPQEIAMRETILRSKDAKLKNPSIFISKLRLCLRNIPLNVDDKLLRKACQKIAGSNAQVTECRVMRDLKSSSIPPKSLGFAFVAVDNHEDAMKIITALNNNNEILGGNRRPIVEFSLENSRALERRRRREEKSRFIREGISSNKDVSGDVRINRSVFQSNTLKGAKNKGKSKLGKSAKVTTGTRILPKKFGPKIRHKKRVGNSTKLKKKENSRQKKRLEKINKK